MNTLAVVHSAANQQWTSAHFLETVLGSYDISQAILEADKSAHFRLNLLLDGLEEKLPS